LTNTGQSKIVTHKPNQNAKHHFKCVEKLAKKQLQTISNYFYLNLKSNKIDLNPCRSSSVI